jgi:cbb3-type cytochrome c oxidase subunit II
MSLGTIVAGALLILLTVVFMTLGLSTLTFQPVPSDIARPLTVEEEKGRHIYMANGCVYCHTQYVRPQDWNAAGGGKASRVSEAGDYVFDKTALLGTERTGPDLSQEGGVHPDDWHVAHFRNPRFTSPNSIMPQISYLTDEEMRQLIAYMQSLGGKAADVRYKAQKDEKALLLASLKGGQGAKGVTDPNVPYSADHLTFLQQQVPPTWKDLRSAMPPSQRSLIHGKQVYLQNCIGCHGLRGDGNGPAAQFLEPRPFNFRSVAGQRAGSEGQLYHFLLFGLPGSAMPAFGDFLTVNDIWDVINFIRTIPNGGLEVPETQLLPQLMVTGGQSGPQPAPFDQTYEDSYKNPPRVTPVPPTRP